MCMRVVQNLKVRNCLLRFIDKDDLENLLTIYSDINSLPFLTVIIVMVIIFIILQKIK